MSWGRVFALTFILAALGPPLMIFGVASERDWLVQLGFESLVLAALWLSFHLGRRILQRILFRVGNRLFLSYLLIGVVPVFLVLCLALVLIYLLTGQLAVRRVEHELERSLEQLRTTAAAMADELEVGSDASQRREVFARHRPPGAGIGWALRPLEGGLDGEGPLDPALLLPEGRVQTSLEAVGRLADRNHFLAVVPPPGPAGTVIVYQRIEPELRSRLEEATRVALRFPQATGEIGEAEAADIAIDNEGANVRLRLGPDPDPAAAGRLPPRVPGSWLFGKSFVIFPRAVELPYVDWSDADWHAAIEGRNHFNLVAQTSMAREYIELFQSAGADDVNLLIGQGAVAIPQYLSIAVVTLYLLAAAVAGILIYRIARATSCLLKGFRQVEQGNFQVELSFRGRDQLAGLVQSFNRMARHLAQSVEEKAEREAIERELGIARQLQRSLLPPADYCAPGFEIAVDFVPAQAIGGDFYHFTRRDDGRLLVTIADVSGHGLSTGIVMSAAKALLSALATDYCPCAELLRRLDDELRSHTGRRHFVTLGLCVFDLEEGTLELTNAGHPYPYRLERDGTLTAIENPSRPLAVALPQNFRSVEAKLERGDLWILYSDGVIEAQSPDGEVFGFERFENLLRGCAGQSAAATRDRVLEAWRGFTGGECPADDRTLLVIRIAD